MPKDLNTTARWGLGNTTPESNTTTANVNLIRVVYLFTVPIFFLVE